MSEVHTTARRLLLNAWNGPFYLGPLTKPVAATDALMKILEVIWKFGFVAMCGLILVAIWIPIGLATGVIDSR
jgi:hypothetical protein